MTITTTNSTVDLTQLLSGAQLPALPQSAIRLLELSKDPDNGPAEFAVPIEADPGLASQVLRFVNSSYFGFSREIATVKLAITLVGIRTIKNFALWSAVFSLMPNPKCGQLDLKALWQDSLTRGLFARAAGKILGLKDAEEAFSAGLLQDMAIPLLAKELPEQYAQLLEKRANGAAKLSQLETEEFGWSHSDAATQIANTWNLPEEFADLIGCHTELQSLLESGEASPGQLAVAMSALLPPTCDETWVDFSQFVVGFEQTLAKHGTSPSELLSQVDTEMAEFAPVLDMAAPAKTLVDFYNEATGAES